MPKQNCEIRKRSTQEIDQLVSHFLEKDLAAIRNGHPPLSLVGIPLNRCPSIYQAEDQVFIELITQGKTPIFRAKHAPSLPDHIRALIPQPNPTPQSAAANNSSLTPAEISMRTELNKLRANTWALQPDDNALADDNELGLIYQSLKAKLQQLEDQLAYAKKENLRLTQVISSLRSPSDAPLPQTGNSTSSPTSHSISSSRPRKRPSAKPRPKAESTVFHFGQDNYMQTISDHTMSWYRPEVGGILAAPEASLLARVLSNQWQKDAKPGEHGFMRITYVVTSGRSTPVFDADFCGGSQIMTDSGKNHQSLAAESLSHLLHEFDRSLRKLNSLLRYPDVPGQLRICANGRRKFAYLGVQNGALVVTLSTDSDNPQLNTNCLVASLAALSHIAFTRGELQSPATGIARQSWSGVMRTVNNAISQLKAKEYQNWDRWRNDTLLNFWPSKLN